jgi:hypothetical protein
MGRDDELSAIHAQMTPQSFRVDWNRSYCWGNQSHGSIMRRVPTAGTNVERSALSTAGRGKEARAHDGYPRLVDGLTFTSALFTDETEFTIDPARSTAYQPFHPRLAPSR